MKLFVFILFLGLALADPEAQYLYNYAPSYAYPVDASNVQHHAQDGFGQYHYGYSSPTSGKTETKTADGVVQGSYRYIDANGILQTVNYISDALGFRVSATNLPQAPSAAIEPKVAYVEAAPIEAVEAVEAAQPVAVAAPQQQITVPYHYNYAPSYYYNPLQAPVQQTYQYVHQPVPYVHQPVQAVEQPEVNAEEVLDIRTGYDAAVPVQAAVQATIPVQAAVPVQAVVPAPVQVPVISKYHAQDEFGQYQFGYADAYSNRNENRDLNGVVSGSYNYVDANGVPQTVNYIADHQGFRAQGTTIQFDAKAAPLPVEDTPEVVAARAAHLKAYAAAAKLTEDNYVYAAAAPVLLDLPKPVEDTPEVLAAREAHLKAVAELKAKQIVYEAPVDALAPVEAPVVDYVPAVVPVQAPVSAPVQVYAQAPVQAPVQFVVQAPVSAPVQVYAQAPVEAPVQVAVQAPVQVPVPAPYVYAQAPVQQSVPTQVYTAPVASSTPLVYAPTYGYNAASQVQATQFHAQDVFGNYNYGYSNGNSAKHESKGPDGITRGSYSYVDANGLVQVVNYISDAAGFRVQATNLPQAPVAAPVEAHVVPEVKAINEPEEAVLDIRRN